MSLLMARSRQNGYSKIDNEDPEERKHRQAQFLIYKVMEQANHSSRRRPSCLGIRIRKLKVRIGRRFKKLKKAISMSLSAATNGFCKQFGYFKTSKSLFGRGKERNLAGFPPLFT